MSKFEKAILQLAQSRASVESLTLKIGDALGACLEHQVRYNPESDFVDHLRAAYAMGSDEDDYGGSTERYFINHDGDAGAYLSGICPHCHAAHDAIQERKAAKKQYGIDKRRIALLGSAMLASKAKATGETP